MMPDTRLRRGEASFKGPSSIELTPFQCLAEVCLPSAIVFQVKDLTSHDVFLAAKAKAQRLGANCWVLQMQTVQVERW